MNLRFCLNNPIPQIFAAADYMSQAAEAHLIGNTVEAERLFRLADDPLVRAFTETAWGAGSKARYAFVKVIGAPPYFARPDRPHPRMPTPATEKAVLERDGYHCRFCGIPVVASALRKQMSAAYPETVSWGKTNLSQHAAFQCMWLQFDHVLPNSRGGTSDLDNIVVTCAPCNFGRMEATLIEAGLCDPRDSFAAPSWHGASHWDGLERLRQGKTLSNRPLKE